MHIQTDRWKHLFTFWHLIHLHVISPLFISFIVSASSLFRFSPSLLLPPPLLFNPRPTPLSSPKILFSSTSLLLHISFIYSVFLPLEPLLRVDFFLLFSPSPSPLFLILFFFHFPSASLFCITFSFHHLFHFLFFFYLHPLPSSSPFILLSCTSLFAYFFALFPTFSPLPPLLYSSFKAFLFFTIIFLSSYTFFITLSFTSSLPSLSPPSPFLPPSPPPLYLFSFSSLHPFVPLIVSTLRLLKIIMKRNLNLPLYALILLQKLILFP